MSDRMILVLDHGYVRLVDSMGSDQSIVNAARVSYDGSSKGEEADKKLLRYLWVNKHHTPFEMCRVVFEVKAPIFVARQWFRHRAASYNEVSARYTELPDEFYIPNQIRTQDAKNKQGSVAGEAAISLEEFQCNLAASYRTSYDYYRLLIGAGVARELARIVLPAAIYTKYLYAADLRNFLHFLSLRDDGHAQSEIREYARAMKEIARDLFPWTMEIYEESR